MRDAPRGIAMSGRSEVTVAAPVDAVWRLVSDVTRNPEWSHECDRVRWVDPAIGLVPGARFRGHSRSGWARWTRTCELLSVEPSREIAWRTLRTWRFLDTTEWRITLRADASGTRIVQTFEVTSCPAWWAWLMGHVVSAHIDRSAGLTADLHRLGRVAAETASA